MAQKKTTAKATAIKRPVVAPEEKPASSRSKTCFVGLNRVLGLNFPLPGGRVLHLDGNGAPLRGKEKGILSVGTYQLTEVDAEDWAYVKKTFGKMAAFVNGLIIDAPARQDVLAEAESRRELRHGMEPVNPAQTRTSPLKGDL